MSDGDRAGTAMLEQPESPFLGFTETSAEVNQPAVPLALVESPFLMEYQLGDEVVDREASGIRELLEDLYDTEFDETLDELLEEAEGELDRLGLDETPAGAARGERMLDQWVEPLRLEAEAMFDRMAEALDGEELSALADEELEGIMDRFEPRDTGLSPVMEDFLGKLWKKAKKAVSGAVKLVKKGVAAATKLLPIGTLLRPLKKLVAPLLKRVIRFAINKLPPALQPYASQLAKRFLGELEELDEASESIPASPTSAICSTPSMPRSSPCSWRRRLRFATKSWRRPTGRSARTRQPPPPNSTRPANDSSSASSSSRRARTRRPWSRNSSRRSCPPCESGSESSGGRVSFGSSRATWVA